MKQTERNVIIYVESRQLTKKVLNIENAKSHSKY